MSVLCQMLWVAGLVCHYRIILHCDGFKLSDLEMNLAFAVEVATESRL